jgi:hypothetical protein
MNGVCLAAELGAGRDAIRRSDRVSTPSALKSMDLDKPGEAAGRPVRYDYKQRDEPDAFPPPDAVVVAPATFNTVNKWSSGDGDLLPSASSTKPSA